MKNLVIILVCVGVFLGSLAGAGSMTGSINQQRKEKNLTFSDRLYDMPPEMAVAQAALGTFRGLAVNALWQRAEALKQEGKFYEAVQLGEWITRLQPRFPQVWEFVTWNQAYNISVATHTQEERWYWVKSGIDLLQRRGGGIDANPHELRLYWQLGWIYYHKVGQFQDNMSWYYKQRVAERWHNILGNPPREQAAYEEWLEAIALAPRRPEGLPESARRLARWVETAVARDPEQALWQLTIPQVPEQAQQPADADTAPSWHPDDLDPTVRTLFVPPRAWPEWARQQDIDLVIAHLRHRAIASDELNMDPAAMLRDARRFGPMDWRHPSAHTVYWSRRGLESVEDTDRWRGGIVNLRRNVFFGLRSLAQAGQVVYEPYSQYVSYLPHWHMWLSYDDFYDELVSQAVAEAEAEGDTAAAEAIREHHGGGHRNHMDQAIISAELFGARRVAEQLFERMRERYAGTFYAERYESMDDLMAYALVDTIENPDTARMAVTGMLHQALASQWITQNPHEAQRFFDRAQQLYNGWREMNPTEADPLYQEIPPFGQLYADVAGSFLTGNAGPYGAQQVPLDVRAAFWHTLHEDAQAYIFANFGEQMHQQATMAGYNPEEAFPTPPRLVPQGRPLTRDQLRQTTPGDRGQIERR